MVVHPPMPWLSRPKMMNSDFTMRMLSYSQSAWKTDILEDHDFGPEKHLVQVVTSAVPCLCTGLRLPEKQQSEEGYKRVPGLQGCLVRHQGLKPFLWEAEYDLGGQGGIKQSKWGEVIRIKI